MILTTRATHTHTLCVLKLTFSTEPIREKRGVGERQMPPKMGNHLNLIPLFLFTHEISITLIFFSLLFRWVRNEAINLL